MGHSPDCIHAKLNRMTKDFVTSEPGRNKHNTCGREPACDLVLEIETYPVCTRVLNWLMMVLSPYMMPVQAMAPSLTETISWVRARKVILCIGDRIRFGDVEVPLERLTAVFGKHATTRLEARRFPSGRAKQLPAEWRETRPGASLNKPRRNPATGKIEDVSDLQQHQNMKI